MRTGLAWEVQGVGVFGCLLAAVANYSPSRHHFGVLILCFHSRVPWRVNKEKHAFCIGENSELAVISSAGYLLLEWSTQ